MSALHVMFAGSLGGGDGGREGASGEGHGYQGQGQDSHGTAQVGYCSVLHCPGRPTGAGVLLFQGRPQVSVGRSNTAVYTTRKKKILVVLLVTLQGRPGHLQAGL